MAEKGAEQMVQTGKDSTIVYPIPCNVQVSSKIAASYTMADFCRPISNPGMSINDIQVSCDV
jgi:hypothetical protein